MAFFQPAQAGPGVFEFGFKKKLHFGPKIVLSSDKTPSSGKITFFFWILQVRLSYLTHFWPILSHFSHYFFGSSWSEHCGSSLKFWTSGFHCEFSGTRNTARAHPWFRPLKRGNLKVQCWTSFQLESPKKSKPEVYFFLKWSFFTVFRW